MSIKINYSNKAHNKTSSNVMLFANDKFNISNLKKFFSVSEFSYISDLLKTSDLKKNLLIFEVNSKKKIVLISIKKNLKTYEIENLGAELYDRINYGKNSEYFLISDSLGNKHDIFLGHFLHGLKLKSYEFKKYKSKKDSRKISINITGTRNKPSAKSQLNFKAIEEGTFYARDLVSEPGNVLHPDEYAKRLSTLKKDGLKVNIYDEKIKKTWYACFAWCGARKYKRSYLVTMEWNGTKNNSKPLAFVGKGVCFDTGGYSLNLQDLWKT